MTCPSVTTPELTEDGFLGGRLRVLQPRRGYRAATDAVFLAAAVPARPGQSVLELGCGAAVAALCLAARVPRLTITGVEVQPEYADLARRNAATNSVALDVVTSDLADLPAGLRGARFDHVMANPPYYSPQGGTAARDPGRETAQREETPLSLWIDVALRRLSDGGWLTLIQRAERLPEVLAALSGRTGSIAALPLAPREGRQAGRVVVRARKGARGPFRLLAPLVVHTGRAHDSDGDDFADAARAVLRAGAALSFDDA